MENELKRCAKCDSVFCGPGDCCHDCNNRSTIVKIDKYHTAYAYSNRVLSKYFKVRFILCLFNFIYCVLVGTGLVIYGLSIPNIDVMYAVIVGLSIIPLIVTGIIDYLKKRDISHLNASLDESFHDYNKNLVASGVSSLVDDGTKTGTVLSSIASIIELAYLYKSRVAYYEGIIYEMEKFGMFDTRSYKYYGILAKTIILRGLLGGIVAAAGISCGICLFFPATFQDNYITLIVVTAIAFALFVIEIVLSCMLFKRCSKDFANSLLVVKNTNTAN